ncbi:ABC transporter ATP-binding protein [Mycetocola tolaasinivorans]|uniref:ABC transporter ATP-binding protein n=1 Tax=Mycetocola tolaasinivorans TaxID=76635 RepID=UPI0016035DBF|nr:ATP-binding cassette domain-containing protein [Mycetocola tolaasinivorans]
MRVAATELSFAHSGAAPLYSGLSFRAEGGDLVALTGPSGSGKSTLLSLLGGWLAPTAGTLEISGDERVALVSQNPHGVPGRTALDHVCLPLVAAGMRRDEAVTAAREYLSLVRLEHVAERPYRMLSGGERQRMLLARALASRPGMLLVDEPTAQLDAASAREVCEVLSNLGQRGALIFIATHDHRVVDACSRVIDLLTVVPPAAEVSS